ncbi:MarR family transcriptional regulator [Paenibacillus glycanilyticus]|uniref:MarR family winged helix-turn-helix transcriptional regulator n=1 Tax=Paenibacillus glycanilyticus TaxID=126569 RepID=UPI00203D24AA|nr:MarR family transcriptional regulator [Paenibacillus glycanilyticus]MCM3627550.1 MarR family transcriptional regulator [Paenibacillus glycanilyticus]
MHQKGLDHSIGFLLGATYRKLTNFFAARIKEYGLTPEQWAVLFRVREEDGLIQKEIADRAGKDKPTTTRILDSLEAKGFVTKRASEHDRRSFQVYITEQGRLTADAIEPIEYGMIAEIAQVMSAAEYEQMTSLLKRLNDHTASLLEQEKE